ncbi:MAG: flagellar export chaperone FlgN, partial [Selenomonadaceae bacterium]|nr:flagellar export chaperone FlgN [Selenomonadaceae bacterium]
MWQNLIETLDKLSEVYDSWATLGEKKRTALVAIDMKELSNLLDAEQLLAAKIQKLEQRRVEILKNLSKSDKTLNETTSAKDFYRKAPTLAAQKKLLQLHERLSKNVDKA